MKIRRKSTAADVAAMYSIKKATEGNLHIYSVFVSVKEVNKQTDITL